MKKLVLSFLWFTQFVFPSKNQELFLQANNAYLQRNLTEALSLYKQIENKGPAVWYNMGAASFELENFLDALIYFKRAKKGAMISTLEKLEPLIEKTQQQLNIVQEKSFMQKMGESFVQLVSLLPLLPLQLLCLLFALVLVWSVYWFLSAKRYILLVILFIFLILSLVLLLIKYKASRAQSGILIKETDVFVGPQEEFHTITKLSVGYQVSVKKLNDNWYKIKKNGLSGWIPADTIAII